MLQVKQLKKQKKKKEKTAVEEGALEYENEIVGSDYSDEDEYIENNVNGINMNKIDNNNNININKENVDNNINIDINNNDKCIILNKNVKIEKNEVKQKNKDIKKNLLTKFNNEESKEISIENNYFDDLKFNGALSK